MEKLVINTELDNFLLIDKITKIDKKKIEGEKHFFNYPQYLGIESLAQLGALHVRYLFDCSKHAFLLKINDCSFFDNSLDGTGNLQGFLKSKSDRTFCYKLYVKINSKKIIDSEMTFSTIAYNALFKRETLKGHYEKVLKCLLID